ncbi:MAG: energy transducer TonB [Bacteroidales bacterium]|jgi:outer membrane biosynthesis protein TonB|nr:energy transducer TonB [Bacteroidales bacterium]
MKRKFCLLFKVDTNGNIIDPRIERGVRWDLDEEALRVIKLFKFDSPALDFDGKPAGMCYPLPIKFKIDKYIKKGKKKTIPTH